MKYFWSTLILAGLIVPVLPLIAEEAQMQTSSEFISEEEESILSALEDEISFLDEEFVELEDEISSLEESLQLLDQELPSVAEAVEPSMQFDEEQVVVLEEDSAAVEPQEENVIATEQTSPAAELPQEEKVIAAEQSAPVAELPQENLTAEEQLPILIQPPVAQSELIPIEAQVIHNVMGENAPTQFNQTALAEKELIKDIPAPLNFNQSKVEETSSAALPGTVTVDLQQAFAGSPIIYSILLAMSVISVCIWLYAIIAVRSSARISRTFLQSVHNKLSSNNFDDVLVLCEEKKSLFSKMLTSGIHSRRHGLPVMIEAMKAEGKRSSIGFWQKIGLLNDIAIIAPMLGLLGTVLGMFYAFYDINRSIESISTLFDGLGISVGTTVAGLVVAILALILHSTAKYRLVKALALVENEAQSVAVLIDDRTSIHRSNT